MVIFMLNVNIITVGKLKEKYLRDACNEYCKRLGAYCKIKIVELNESRLSNNPSEKEIQNALSVEADSMMPFIQIKNSYNIAMCIEGTQMGSIEFSDKIEQITVSGNSTINFIIGSSFGISPEIKNKSNYRMSMSKMTFPHQLARVMLTEQIYRAFQILSNGKYHK